MTKTYSSKVKSKQLVDVREAHGHQPVRLFSKMDFVQVVVQGRTSAIPEVILCRFGLLLGWIAMLLFLYTIVKLSRYF